MGRKAERRHGEIAVAATESVRAAQRQIWCTLRPWLEVSCRQQVRVARRADQLPLFAAPRVMFAMYGECLLTATWLCLFYLMVFILLVKVICRRTLITYLACIGMVFFLQLTSGEDQWFLRATTFISVVMPITILMRWGILAAVSYFFANLTLSVICSHNIALWYGTTTLVSVLLFVLAVGCGARRIGRKITVGPAGRGWLGQAWAPGDAFCRDGGMRGGEVTRCANSVDRVFVKRSGIGDWQNERRLSSTDAPNGRVCPTVKTFYWCFGAGSANLG